MKNKLRAIVVLNRRFYWNFSDKIERTENENVFVTKSTLNIFPIENKKSKLTLIFQTWIDPIAGSPLNTGVKAQNFSERKIINLNHPGIVSEIIEFLITNKIWSGENLKPIRIDGLKILSELGYKVENLNS